MLIIQTAAGWGMVRGFGTGLGGSRLVGVEPNEAETLQQEIPQRAKGDKAGV